MVLFWIKLMITFDEPIPFVEENTNEHGKGAEGFLQEIGCTAESEEEAKGIVMEHLRSIDWLDLSKSTVTFDRIGEIALENVAAEIYGDDDIKGALIADPLIKGIWYLSGKGFYCEKATDDDFYRVKVTRKPD